MLTMIGWKFESSIYIFAKSATLQFPKMFHELSRIPLQYIFVFVFFCCFDFVFVFLFRFDLFCLKEQHKCELFNKASLDFSLMSKIRYI